MWCCQRLPRFFKALRRDAPNLADPPTSGTATTITSVLAVDSPGIDIFRVAREADGCSPTASSGTATSFNLGQGSFVPTQLIVSQDALPRLRDCQRPGQRCWCSISSTRRLPRFPSPATPSQSRPRCTPDGSRLYIAAADGQVHVLDTQNGGDIQQISFPTDPTTLPGWPVQWRHLHLQSGFDRGQAVKQSSVVGRQSSVGGPPCGRERPRSCHPGHSEIAC